MIWRPSGEPAPCAPRARKGSHPRRFTVIHGQLSARLTCTAMWYPSALPRLVRARLSVTRAVYRRCPVAVVINTPVRPSAQADRKLTCAGGDATRIDVASSQEFLGAGLGGRERVH